jgi:hypothetical protein
MFQDSCPRRGVLRLSSEVGSLCFSVIRLDDFRYAVNFLVGLLSTKSTCLSVKVTLLAWGCFVGGLEHSK